MARQQALGILGGTFDPIHNGHIQPALEVAARLDIAKLLLMPLGNAVHREQPGTGAEHRLAMCQLAAQASPLIEVDDREMRRERGSYTVLTLEELREEQGGLQPLCFLMGQDAFDDFLSWRAWPRILELAHVVVMERPGYDTEAPLAPELEPYHRRELEGPAGCIVLQTVQPQPFSSTQLRAALAAGENVAGALDENVRKYIQRHQLYSHY